MRVVTVQMENWHATSRNNIGGSNYTGIDVLSVVIEQDMGVGRGFAIPNAEAEETADTILAEAKAIQSILEIGLCKDRHQLQELLPPGGARQAIDFAIWDLQTHFTRHGFWRQAGLKPRQALHFVDLTQRCWEHKQAQVDQALVNVFRVQIDDLESVEQLLELDARFPFKRWIICVSDKVNLNLIRMLLKRMNVRSIVALELPSQVWREGSDLSAFRHVPLSIIEDDSASSDIWHWGTTCQYLTLSMTASGGLTHIVNRCKEAALRGVGTILCNTDQCTVNSHAMDVIFSMSDWVSSAQDVYGGWYAASEGNVTPSQKNRRYGA